MSAQWVERNGKRILFFDHRGATSEQIVENIAVAKQMVANMTGGLLTLADFTGATVDMTALQHVKTSGKEVFEAITEKQAIIGVHGLRHIMLQAYNTFTGAGDHQRLFNTEEEAYEWLTS